MEHLAMALALSVKHLETRVAEAENDSDVSALEEISAELQLAAPSMQEAVAEAFRKLHAPELIEGIGLQTSDG